MNNKQVDHKTSFTFFDPANVRTSDTQKTHHANSEPTQQAVLNGMAPAPANTMLVELSDGSKHLAMRLPGETDEEAGLCYISRSGFLKSDGQTLGRVASAIAHTGSADHQQLTIKVLQDRTTQNADYIIQNLASSAVFSLKLSKDKNPDQHFDSAIKTANFELARIGADPLTDEQIETARNQFKEPKPLTDEQKDAVRKDFSGFFGPQA